MIYVELFLGFLRVGCFAFGGAYGAISLIRDTVLAYGWLSDEVLSYMIAVSECTPGPIMVNLATYVGSDQAGIFGAAIATFAVVLPSFLIILVIMIILDDLLKNKYIQAILKGLKPCIIGIILATGMYTIFKNCLTANSLIEVRAVVMTMILGVIMFIIKKDLSPIKLIILSAILGIFIYGI